MRICELFTVFFNAFLAISLLFSPYPAAGHEINTSYTTIRVSKNTLEIIFAFNPADLARAFAIDENHDNHFSEEEVQAAIPKIFDFLEQEITVGINFRRPQITREKKFVSEDLLGHSFLNFPFSALIEKAPDEVSFHINIFERFGARHKNLVHLTYGEIEQQAVLSKEKPESTFTLGKEISLYAQLGDFVELGVEHIFLGYDHIAFLLALIIAGGTFGSLVRIITSFTIAHSITLILAALQFVALPSRLIESGIALSILYVSCENLFSREIRNRWIITFFFGLIHGFGFASVLRELGLPTRGLVSSLLAFNVGVELGQLCIVLVFFPITLWLARWRFHIRVVHAISILILCLSLGWLIERVFRVPFMPF